MAVNHREVVAYRDYAEQLNTPDWTGPAIVPGPEGYLQRVEAAVDVAEIRQLIANDLLGRGRLYADKDKPFNPDAPFIYYPPMNREPETWLGLAIARIAQEELDLQDGTNLAIATLPSSANWYDIVMSQHEIFPQAQPVLLYKEKDKKMIPQAASVARLEILSYVHARHADNSRGVEIMYLANPEKLDGAKVCLFDDALAEGYSLLGVAEALKDQFGVAHIDGVVALSKGDIQEGRTRIETSGYIDRLVVGVEIASIDPSLRNSEQTVPVANHVQLKQT